MQVNENEKEIAKKYFGTYCRTLVGKGVCNEGICGYCPINTAYRLMFEERLDERDENGKLPDDPNLPNEVTIPLNALLNGQPFNMNEDELSGVVEEYLSDTYGFCLFSFKCFTENDALGNATVHVTDIDWDTDE